MDDESIIWVVVKYDLFVRQSRSSTIFRTRYAARRWAAKQRNRSKRWYYKVHKATWGPETIH